MMEGVMAVNQVSPQSPNLSCLRIHCPSIVWSLDCASRNNFTCPPFAIQGRVSLNESGDWQWGGALHKRVTDRSRVHEAGNYCKKLCRNPHNHHLQLFVFFVPDLMHKILKEWLTSTAMYRIRNSTWKPSITPALSNISICKSLIHLAGQNMYTAKVTTDKCNKTSLVTGDEWTLYYLLVSAPSLASMLRSI